MHCKLVLTNKTFLFWTSANQSQQSTPSPPHTPLQERTSTQTQTGCSCGSLKTLCLLPLSLLSFSLTRTVEVCFVDQCVSEAVICLAAALLWVGRWSGYPYPPSGHPGMDEIWSWPSAEQDQGITISPSIQAICTGLSNNEHTLVINSRTIIEPGVPCPNLIPANILISAPEPESGVVGWNYIKYLS